MVTYEAASTIVSLKCVTPKELSSAVNVLQLFISSPKPVLRYAAVRTLNKVCFTSLEKGRAGPGQWPNELFPLSRAH
jgi:hypothetical protein